LRARSAELGCRLLEWVLLVRRRRITLLLLNRASRVKRIKIFGAGSIGTHHAHAARMLGWDVVVCDSDARALERMRSQLYPSRYGSWDASIELTTPEGQPRTGFDLVVVGTPPDSHIPLARAALAEQPTAVLIEKPLTTPAMAGVEELNCEIRSSGVRVFVGYDHVVGRAAVAVDDLLRAGVLGAVSTIDVEFREHWAGIFQAHPWLSGPDASYLGHWQRGGGAAGEHSHALNLWQHFAHAAGLGRVIEVQAMIDYVTEGTGTYDRLCLMHLRTASGIVGRAVQDVVTGPPRKWGRIQGSLGALEWVAGYQPGIDAVILRPANGAEEVQQFAKTRPDDFIRELQHLEQHCANGLPSPIDFDRGVDTMNAIAAAHESERTGRRVQLDSGVPGGLRS
jgi:predicted dehydrogenase